MVKTDFLVLFAASLLCAVLAGIGFAAFGFSFWLGVVCYSVVFGVVFWILRR